jgi:RNA polymerase sigma factor (sigma-70 family)
MKAAVSPAEPADVESLYRGHYRSLFRLAAVFLDDASAADDVVQDAFLRLQSGRTGPRAGNELSWLRQVVVNGCRERHRRRQTAQRLTPVNVGQQPPADESVIASDVSRAVATAVDRLPARQRECVVLHHFERLNETEISQVLGISVGSVKTHLHRGRAALRPVLEKLR